MTKIEYFLARAALEKFLGTLADQGRLSCKMLQESCKFF